MVTKLIIQNDLVYKEKVHNDNILSCFEGDSIAIANGFLYVEGLIRYYGNGVKLEIGKNLQITRRIK